MRGKGARRLKLCTSRLAIAARSRHDLRGVEDDEYPGAP